MALEPPEPPTFPAQAAGYHDRPDAPPFGGQQAHVGGGGSPSSPGPAGPGWPPAGPFPPQVRPKPSRAGLVVVSIVAVLLLAAGGVVTYLWQSTSSELADTKADLNAQIADLNGSIEEHLATIDQLNDDLATAGSEMSDLEQERDGIENARQALEEDLDTVANCLDLLFAFLAEQDLDVAEAMIDDVNDACLAADRVVAANR